MVCLISVTASFIFTYCSHPFEIRNRNRFIEACHVYGHPHQYRTIHICFPKVGLSKVGFIKRGSSEVGIFQVGLIKVGVSEEGFGETGFRETGCRETGTPEVGFAKIDFTEVGFSKGRVGANVALAKRYTVGYVYIAILFNTDVQINHRQETHLSSPAMCSAPVQILYSSSW